MAKPKKASGAGEETAKETNEKRMLEIPDSVEVPMGVSQHKDSESVECICVVDFTQCDPADVLAFAVRTARINLQGKIRNQWGNKDPKKVQVPVAGEKYTYIVKGVPERLTDKDRLKRHLGAMDPSERKAYLEEIMADLNEQAVVRK